MVKYEKITATVIKKIDGDASLFVPVDKDNTDYKEFLVWEAAGGVLAETKK